MGLQFGQVAAAVFFVQLGEFSAHAGLAVAAAVFGEFLQAALQAMGGFVENEGAGELGEVFKTGLAPFLVG